MGARQPTKRESRELLLGNLPWYNYWLRSQASQQPKELYTCIEDSDGEFNDNLFGKIKSLYLKISDAVVNEPTLSINDIVQRLIEDGGIIVSEETQGLKSAIDLVFSIIGWQTMLYRPDVFSCPPSEFGIADEMDGHRGESHICFRQSRTGSNKRLPDFLLGFGLMLPPRNYHTLDDPEEIKNFNRLKSIDHSTLNMYLLTTIGGVTVSWTDCLACHLELDSSSRLLYLFRYPSFCTANMKNQSSEGNSHSVIYSCASDIPSNSYWATPQDVTELLEEIVLSYRLLFGQHHRSRKLLRKLRPFDHVPPNGRDNFLSDVCEGKPLDASLGIVERDSYELARDFPHLRARLVRLNTYLDDRKPRSWRELWLDNRDSASWLTFWAVIVIGGIGLILSFIQVALQIAQVAMSVQQPN
ncbi:uncharacterized protein F4807DRAFT_16969 [Annulohypoxylon truncatum]|uniref:uncharacterized protein n=1 Tax=Annulohypoxylon truncatum TaxID=327061 RepID=UPI002008D168|nr:uncharacterized protein F4807DRAFT_16969 [Annulohypoxylon truncatum]KAI1215006.1 hypothetical protein F4807DRAFT_16969 [Annulohypoxylon truncatum]